MQVRQVGPDDDAEWTRVRDALWPGLPGQTHAADLAEFRAEQTTQAVFVIDRGNGQLGGFLEAGTRKYSDGCDTSPVGYIEGWYVEPDLRRSGWGRALGPGRRGMGTFVWISRNRQRLPSRKQPQPRGSCRARLPGNRAADPLQKVAG
jgi:hypothetical protein